MEDTLNDKQREVMDTWTNTTRNIFCTGHGGTGKSWVLKCICKKMSEQNSETRPIFAITAPTGAAALDIGGITINRFAGIGTETENVGNMIARAQSAIDSWKMVDVLVIDEISMVSGIFFQNLSLVAQHIRGSSEPFGGIRLLILGDFLQLPPVSKFKFRPFRAFECEAWRECNIKTILLTETVRQSDIEFTNILSHIRMGITNDEINNYINACSRNVTYTDNIEPVRLFALKKYVEIYNNTLLSRINETPHEFRSVDTGTLGALSGCSAPPVLTLKKGAQVMIIRNLSRTLVNGTIGIVRDFITRHDIIIPTIEVIDTSGVTRLVTVSREKWEAVNPSGSVIASRVQIPIILAWAITIHKSQGKSIPRLYVDMSGIFEVGQAYVALSRCESPNTLQVVNYTPESIKSDAECVGFYNKLSNSEVPIEEAPPEYTEHGPDMRTVPAYTSNEDTATRVASHTNEEWEQHTVGTQIMMGRLSLTESSPERSETLTFDSDA